MGFADAIRSGFNKWSTTSGRASRSEFWLWYLFYVLSVLAVALVASLGAAVLRSSTFAAAAAAVLIVWSLVLVVPSFTLTIRRLHDRDHSGWWFLLNLVPYVGSFILLVVYCLDGSPGPNRFGPRPGGNVASYQAGGPLIGVADELKKLDDLRAAGTISDAEFARQRARLLPE